MLHKSIFSFFTLCAGLALATFAGAQDATLQPSVEVTASRVAETADASLTDVSVITRADIDASNAADLIDLLRLQAGVDVARTGGAGTQTNVFLRGSNANHVLVLIDGVRVASANTGAFAFENLPLDAVQRIEIVRGPRASYWGSDAIGGVIQIFTRKLDGAYVGASLGSYASTASSAGYGQWSDIGGFSVIGGARDVGGFSATNPAAGMYVYNPDNNGMHNANLVAQGAYKIGAQTLSASLFRNQGGVSFDNGDPGHGYSHTLDQAAGVNLEGAVTAEWQQRLSLGTAREDLDTPVFAAAYHSTREQVSWSNALALSPAQYIVAGIDYVHDRGISVDTSGFGAPYAGTRENAGTFAGWRVSDGAFDSEVAGRYDHYSDFGSAFSGSAALGWKVGDALRLTASFGSAFRAPTLNELYSPGYGGYYAGNPDLQPEHSRTLELGAEWLPNVANSLAVHAFSTRVRDLIDFSGGSTFQAINVVHAAIDGVELTQSWHNAVWSMQNNATAQNPRNQDTAAQLLRRPRHKFTTLVERGISANVRAGIEFIASGNRQDVGNYTLPGYALVNLRASYRLANAWRIGLRLDNLFDRNYELVHGYNTPGRSGYLQLVWGASD